MPAHRHLRTLLLCLTIGAAINILVAWGRCFCPIYPGEKHGGAHTLEVRDSWGSDVPADWPPNPIGVVHIKKSMTGLSIYTQTFDAPPVFYARKSTLRVGYPFRSLVCDDLSIYRWNDLKQQYPQTAAFQTSQNTWSRGMLWPWRFASWPWHKWSWPTNDIRIPIRPIPLGFFVNTVIYASLVYAAVATPLAFRTLRRLHRKRHHRCPICAYPLDNLTRCPECGNPTA